MKKAYVLMFALLFAYGCTESALHKYYETEAGEINRTKILEPATTCDPTDENCICMVCTNDNFDLQNPFNQFYSLDLREGTCTFEEGCTEEKFLDLSKAPGFLGVLFGYEQPRFFMLGQGTNFAEFADANRYCNNSLRLAVRWLASPEGYEYPLPQEERAECFMEKDVMPMYLLYSGGTAIDSTHAASIAGTFKDAGPAIITTEFDFDPSNLTQMDSAIDQAIAMKASCPNCLVAIAPRFEYSLVEVNGKPYGYNSTYDALEYIFASSGKSAQALQSIDLVAVGVNSHYSRGCSGVGLIYDALAYSKHSLSEYGKPTVWAYILLDEGEYNSGGVENGTCTWSSSEAVKTYSDLYTYIPAMIEGGIIGMAPYSLYGLDTGPLECKSCGMMAVDGTVYPQHTVWFSNCQVYYTQRGIAPIVFSQVPCADCSFATNLNLYQIENVFFGESPTAENLQGIAPMSTFFRCNAQMMTKVPEEIDLSGYTPKSVTESKCEMYPELDLFADLRDADPVLARAFAWIETGLDDPEEGPSGDMCQASQKPAAECNNCVSQIEDPDGICTAGPMNAQSGKEFHSIGIMMVHTYPYLQWDEVSTVHKEEAEWCGKNEFNPFNKAHNACLGTAIILDKLKSGKNIVALTESQLGLTALKTQYGEDSEEYLNMKNAYTIFISSYYYNGYTPFQNNVNSWIYEFNQQDGITDEQCSVQAGSNPCCNQDGTAKSNDCCGQTNFITYYKKCKLPEYKQGEEGYVPAEYGLHLLGRYKALLECDKYNSAQHKKNLIDYMKQYGGMETAPEP